MTNPTPQGLPPHFPHEADRETGEGLEPACSVSKLHEYAERYAREALRAQAASVEPVVLDTYDAGLLNDFGGGNVEWWLDYIRLYPDDFDSLDECAVRRLTAALNASQRESE